MANVVVRLSIYSEEINADINKFIESLPKPDSSSYLGEVRKLTNGANSPAKQEHSIDYEYRYEDIWDIEIINKDFYIKWMPFINVLKDIVTNHKFSLSLNYEITVYDYEYPSLYFQPSYLAFLGEISAVLSFYYYND